MQRFAADGFGQVLYYEAAHSVQVVGMGKEWGRSGEGMGKAWGRSREGVGKVAAAFANPSEQNEKLGFHFSQNALRISGKMEDFLLKLFGHKSFS